MKKTYFNLSCGVESLPVWRRAHPGESYDFIRIQSTALEQKRFSFVINQLNEDFLLHLALGVEVEVIDASSRKVLPRSLFQGVPWIKYALDRFWYGLEPAEVLVRQNNTARFFAEKYTACLPEIKIKLKYYIPYLCPSDKGVSLSYPSPKKYTLNPNGQAIYDGKEYQHKVYKEILSANIPL